MNTIEKIEALKKRTQALAIRVIKLYQQLPQTGDAQIIGKQVLRSATSVAANYRAAARNKSAADRIHKLGTVTEEADETVFWLELLIEAEIVPQTKLQDLIQESEEILKIMSTTLYQLKKAHHK